MQQKSLSNRARYGHHVISTTHTQSTHKKILNFETLTRFDDKVTIAELNQISKDTLHICRTVYAVSIPKSP